TTGGILNFNFGRGAFFNQDSYLPSHWGDSQGGRFGSIFTSGGPQSGGGVGCYDPNYSEASMMRLKEAAVSINVGAATQTVSNFIPAGAIVYGFTAYVTAAIGGPTSLSVGPAASPNLWINAMGVTSGSQGGLANASATGPVIYPT